MKTQEFRIIEGKPCWVDRQMTQQEQEVVSVEREEKRQARIARLRFRMNAPLRHLERTVKRSGKWGETLTFLEQRLDGGFLIGLVGSRGNGKTQMATSLMLTATERLWSALFCTATGFFMEIKKTFQDGAAYSQQAVLEKYTTKSLVVIDEIGKRSDSDWENNLLFEMINQRYNWKLDTLLIDNRTKQEFVTALGPSLASRMSESGGIIECDWESFR